MAKKIVLFNHKGGVSKTTSTFNIGWMLASKGFRVMLVDADPQCNLTSIFLGDDFDDYYTGVNAKNNIMDGVRSAFEGTPTPIVAIETPSHARNGNLYLLPGHMNLSEFALLHIPLGSNHGVTVDAGCSLYYLWMDFFMEKEGQEWLNTHNHVDEEE